MTFGGSKSITLKMAHKKRSKKKKVSFMAKGKRISFKTKR